MEKKTYVSASEHANRIQIRTLESIHIIEKRNIIRCEACRNYTTIYLLNEKSILASHTLKDFEELLPYPLFLRIHQSHLVNTNYIKRIEKQEACMFLFDDTIIPIAYRKRNVLSEYLKSLPSV